MSSVYAGKTTRVLNVYHISWVLHPYASAGPGPGVSALEIPKALRNSGINASIIVPEHRGITQNLKPKAFPATIPPISIAGQERLINIKQKEKEGLQIYSVGNPELFDRDNLYGEPDELIRIIFFSLGILYFLQKSPPDVLVCHDWPTGLIPAYLKRIFSEDPKIGQIPPIYYSYDPKYEGLFGVSDLSVAGLGFERYTPAEISTGVGISLRKTA